MESPRQRVTEKLELVGGDGLHALDRGADDGGGGAISVVDEVPFARAR